jgi:hypothetical protein
MVAEERDELHDLLIRIDERVKSIQEDIAGINRDRRCHTHTEKIRSLERAVWGTVTVVAGVTARVFYEVFR